MKKTITILLAAAMLAATAAGCGKNNETAGSSSSSSLSSSEPSSSASSSESSAEEGAVGLTIKDEKLKAAYEAVRKEFGEFYLSMPAVITEQQMTEMYYVSGDDVEEFVGEMSIANVSGDTFVAAKAKPGKADAVAAALNKRRDDIIEQFRTYPVNFMDIKSEAAKVITEGDYVFLVLMGDINVPDGQDASLEMAQQEVERAEKAIRSVFSGGAAASGASASGAQPAPDGQSAASGQ